MILDIFIKDQKNISERKAMLLKLFNKFLVVSLLSCSLFTITSCEAKETNMGTCKNLHKVKDIDDLLFQFYSNIESQCLFEMPTQELEKIWGIRILDYIGASSDKKDKLNIEYHLTWENKDGLFLTKEDFERGIPAFSINITKKYRNDNAGWGGSIGQGQFPKLLPPPFIINKPFDPFIKPHIEGRKPITPKNTVYEIHSQYYWLNKERIDQLPVLFAYTDIFPSISSFVLYSKASILNIK